MDGDGLPTLRTVREMLAGRVSHRELALLFELKDGRGRELLSNGAEAEFRVRRVGHGELDIRHAVTLLQNHFAAFRDERRSDERAVLLISIQELVQLWR